MRILVSFYSKTGRTKGIAEELAQALKANNHEVVLHPITPKEDLKAREYDKNGKKIVLVNPLTNLKEFDVVLVGTPVWSFCPSPIVLSYLRQLRAVKGKRFGLFATCTVLPGTTIKRMVSILATKNGKVYDSLILNSVFDFDREKLALARKFAEKLTLI